MNKPKEPAGWFLVAACFVGLAYGLSWIVYVPEALAEFGLLPTHVPRNLYLMAQFGPAIAAIFTVGWFDGRDAVKSLMASIVRMRASLLWYVMILFMPVITLVVAMAAYQLLGHTVPPLGSFFDIPLMIALGTPLSLGEELGWRGFLLDRLMKRNSLLVATGWVAFWWGLWHLPVYLGQRHGGPFYLLFLLGMFPVSAWFTFIYSRTRSVFLCVVFHAAIDAGANYFSSLLSVDHLLFFGLWIAVLWLTAIPAFVALATVNGGQALSTAK